MPKWHVVAGMTTQETQLNPNGAGIIDVEKVTYQIDDGPLAGVQRAITIPVNLYTPDNVSAAINQDAENASAVGGLSN